MLPCRLTRLSGQRRPTTISSPPPSATAGTYSPPDQRPCGCLLREPRLGGWRWSADQDREPPVHRCPVIQSAADSRKGTAPLRRKGARVRVYQGTVFTREHSPNDRSTQSRLGNHA